MTPEAIQQVWIVSLAVFVVVLVVVAVLLTLILVDREEDPWRGVGNLDRRAESRQQHHPPGAPRSTRTTWPGRSCSRLAGWPRRRASSRRMRRRVPAVRSA